MVGAGNQLRESGDGCDQSVVGVLALLWMILALIPLLGWGNWFLIPFAAVGAVIAALGILFTHPSKRGRAWAGLVLNGIVVVVGILRLGLGGGVI
ncbi:hypothetical protein QMZ25_14520 [Stenotrophomonas sp. RS-48]|uniref:hypothetical protein n=1 Tax=Stenotrophomonas sp. RS-48 TaxID=3043300 RepID=UPI0024B62E95|nr:hypothetical protein [Stenotrophomonas sp. RS-48]MDI9249813.1 hypothetical protein [Stenotrophomonas sp. RS-48]